MSRLLEEERTRGIPILDLTISNPTAVLRSYPHAAAGAALGDSKNFSYVPDPLGSEEARSAIAGYYQAKHFDVKPQQIALTATTSEAYALLFKLYCNPSDEILVPTPSYPLFDYLPALENARAVPYRLRYDGSWFIDFADLRQRISSRARAIIVVNPNNPTGSFLKISEREQLVDVAREHNLPLISDEVFMDYEFGWESNRIRTFADCKEVVSFSLSGLSKIAGMPQMKLAWIMINGPVSERQSLIMRLEVLLDAYLSVNTPVQSALPRLLEIGAEIRAELQARTVQNLATAQRLLDDSAVHLLHTEGGWSAVLQLPRTLTEEEWMLQLLRERNVLLQPGFFFDMPSEAYAVASLITEPENFEEGIARVRQFVASRT